MNFLRKILLPVVPVYYLIAWLRNMCFDLGILSSRSYDKPIICVGNLSTGGTGKTPMIEFLIRLLGSEFKVATLSRGYKRATNGFIVADDNATAASIGDEPFQYYRKFKDLIVSVDGDRRNGIAQLLNGSHAPDIILLDDGFQHRKVKTGLNILLTSYDKLYANDIVLPTGNLREPRSGAKRADIIVVTKCPDVLEENEKADIRNRLNLHSRQQLFFSRIKYSDSVYASETHRPLSELRDEDITLVTGIANADPLLRYLDEQGFIYEHLKFKDHHAFNVKDIKIINSKSLILTTEKDYMRLMNHVDPLKLYYLPIETEISEPEKFKANIRNFVKS